ncbi:MAG: hypothetical protein IPK19_20825 [Chloroflexi bacterium]|nr:hypothetical protein [Chloroflexota bacterium]
MPIPAGQRRRDRPWRRSRPATRKTIAQADPAAGSGGSFRRAAPGAGPDRLPGDRSGLPRARHGDPSATATNTLRAGGRHQHARPHGEPLTPLAHPDFQTPTLPPTVTPTDMPDPDLIIT